MHELNECGAVKRENAKDGESEERRGSSSQCKQ